MSIENEIVRNIIIDFNNESSGIYKDDVCRLLIEPEKFDEFIVFLDHYIETGLKTEAADLLKIANAQFQNEPLLIKELKKYTIRIYGY